MLPIFLFDVVFAELRFRLLLYKYNGMPDMKARCYSGIIISGWGILH